LTLLINTLTRFYPIPHQIDTVETITVALLIIFDNTLFEPLFKVGSARGIQRDYHPLYDRGSVFEVVVVKVPMGNPASRISRNPYVSYTLSNKLSTWRKL
jgi:hypothetical protein